MRKFAGETVSYANKYSVFGSTERKTLTMGFAAELRLQTLDIPHRQFLNPPLVE